MEESDLFLPLMGNTFGQLFRVTTFGESHGGGIGVVIDGCPPRIEISEAEIQRELDRRRPGQSKLTTQRKEEDRCEILSGVFEGRTLGTPIAILVRNKDARPEDYSEIARKFRPSHADYTYEAKYGIRNWQGGGRASARETIGRVAAGAIAKKTLSALYADFELVAYVTQIHEVTAKIDRSTVTMNDVEKNVVRCPDAAAAKKMISLVEQIRDAGDSVGGVIECVARGIPPGLGEPVFDKLEADLAKAMLSIPAAKGLRSVPDSRRRRCGARSTTMHSKSAPEEFAQSRTTPGACKVASAMAKTFTFALRLSRLQPSRSSRKPSPLQTRRLRWPPADGMIRVFFHEPCRSSKQWPRSFFAITRCGKTRFQLPIPDCRLPIDQLGNVRAIQLLFVMLSEAKHLWLSSCAI